MRRLAVLSSLLWALAACSDGGGDAAPDADATGGGDLPLHDLVGADSDAGDPDTAEVEDVEDVEDAEVGPALALHATFDGPPADPLAGTDLESCPTYREERCVGGTLQRCAVYDTAAGAFTDDPEPLVRRTFLYDRWYDLYNSPDGQTVKREFTEAMPGDAPESVWGALDVFDRYEGGGDSAIWTGVALTADAYRYMVTGTEADYARMEQTVREQLLQFDVTGIPGYLARYHFLMAPSGAPQTDAHYLVHGNAEDLDHTHHLMEDSDLPGLPDAYREGTLPVDGEEIDVTPMWRGVPSLDQYTGPLIAFPLVWPLVRDDSLRDRMADHVTCYLKRLRRLEIQNLQDAPEAREALGAFFGSGDLALDPDDIDLLSQDTLVGYYQAGLNELNADTFDRSCPDTIDMEPTRVIDATSDDFLLDMFALARDLDSRHELREQAMDHVYMVNVRGADAVHMLHLAAVAWWMTGDETYLEFLEDELLGNLRADEVALTAQAFRNPPWCYKFYGDHISYGAHWQFLTMLEDGPLKDVLVRAMEEEHWQKAMEPLNNAKFNVMYASVVPESVATGLPEAADMAEELLRTFGGNDGVLDAPRRNYDLDRGEVIASLPDHISLVCPTEEERAMCEEPGTVLGIPLEGEEITYECDGRPGECDMGDGLCANAIASEGVPSPLRIYAGFTWQWDPLQLGKISGNPGQQQTHGRDLSEPYWMARHYDVIEEGDGQILAWEEAGTCSR
ncbi:MAG: hypothetical protein ACQEXJ_09560 [Myxococcota bacterium]